MSIKITKSKRDVFLLSICQALWVSSSSFIITTVALVGVNLATDKSLATLPWAFAFLANMVITYPASIIMGKFGRKAGFISALLVGIVGAIVCSVSIIYKSFWSFCLGTFLIGILNAFAMYYRFAAADVADKDYRSRAISYVLAGGVVAAFLGPTIADRTKFLIPEASFAAGYICLIGLYITSILILLFINFPFSTKEKPGGAIVIPTKVFSNPLIIIAIFGGAVSYGSMNLLMSATPLAMDGHGYIFSDTALIIQWHILGMFLPSFFTGKLIKRFGVLEMMLIGVSIFILSVAVNFFGKSLGHFWLGLLLLGVGWNFLFIGATTLLTQVCDVSHKARVQGVNDLIVMMVVCCTAFGSGKLHYLVGWSTMNILVFPVLCILVLALLWTYFKYRRGPHFSKIS